MGYKQTTMKSSPSPKEFGFGSLGFARAQQKPNGSIEPQRMKPLEPRDCGSAGGVFQKKKRKKKVEKKTKLKHLKKKERLKDAAAVDVDEHDDDVATKPKPNPKSESEQHKAAGRGQ